METGIQTSGGGWLSRLRESSSQSGRNSFAVLATAFLVGTGGASTADYLTKRSERGYKLSEVEVAPYGAEALERSPAENVAIIRRVLKPAVGDLAELFGVSRQAVYDWLKGSNPSEENAGRLKDLAKAAELIASSGVSTLPNLLTRALPGGGDLIAVVRSGRSALDAAHSLVAMLQREQRQRADIAARLAGTRRRDVDPRDAGSKMFSDDR